MPSPPSTENGSQIAEQAVEQKRRILETLVGAGNTLAARQFVDAELAKAQSLRRDDPKRGDALALKLHFLQLGGKFKDAAGVAAEIVQIRKAAKPVDHARVALALSRFALALFEAEQPAAGDAALEDSRKAWHKAYAHDDIRLARQLKSGRLRGKHRWLQPTAAGDRAAQGRR
jgi:hypothetical protein